MKFNIRNNSWFKRRAAPTDVIKAAEVDIPDFKFEHGTFCKMYVTYEDGSQSVFHSRILQNQITNKWCVDGMHVIVDVIEEEE